MRQNNAELSIPPATGTAAVERLDRAFRVVSVAIVSLTILLVWSFNNPPTPGEPVPVNVVAKSAPAELSKEWLWKRPDASFDSIYRTAPN